MVKILRYKNQIMWTQAVLIVLAFFSHYLLGKESLALGAFFIAGILGTLPLTVQALSALRVKVVSIDSLVTVASIGALLIQNYEESAIVTFLFLFGAWLEAKTLAYTRSSIRELTDLVPEKAWVRQANDRYEEVVIEKVIPGNEIMVRTGGKVPVDGRIIGGQGHLNESSITGESLPVGKEVGQSVYAGTILENGTLYIQAEAVGEETTFGRIIELVEEAQDSKSAAERFIDHFAKYYTPAVLVIALVVWLATRNVELAITVLVLGCPGALVIGVPVSNVAGIGNGAKHGILLKGSETIQEFAKVDIVVFDKTGTLTLGHPEVTRETSYGPEDPQVRRLLASVEATSDHPLARAISDHLAMEELKPLEKIDVIKGGGLLAQVDHSQVAVGNRFLMEELGYSLPNQVIQDLEDYARTGHSIVLTAVDGQIKLLMGIKDPLRPGLKDELDQLRELGIQHLALASGDNQGAVDLVAQSLGIDQALGHLLPEEKADYVQELQAQGHQVAFVGDGINDAPSLALADIGIGMGAGTDVALETSDVVLVQSDFAHLNHAYGLSKATSRNMLQNVIISLGMVGLLIFLLFFTDWMTMGLGMLLHEGSILMVIFNAMRLLTYRTKS